MVQASLRRPVPPPSRVSLSPKWLPPPPPDWLVRSVLWAREGLQRVLDRLTPPELMVLEKTAAQSSAFVLGALVRAGVFDALGEAPAEAASLAAACGLDADALYRAMRALASEGIFTLGPDGRFAHNAHSRVLKSGGVSRMAEWVNYWSSDSNQRAWRHFDESLRTGRDAFSSAHGMSVWQWFDAHPDERENFAHCMMGLTALSAPWVARRYPFDEVSSVCDVGGGRGILLSEILLRHPHLRGTLAEGAGVLASAEPLLAARGVRGRCTLTEASFFEHVPPGSELYLLKNVLHDWGDAACVTILSRVAAAMTEGQRVLLCEAPVPRVTHDRFGPMSDLQMLVACEGGRERSLAELEALLAAAGFKKGRVFAGPVMSLVEGRR
ncbi:MAG: hypothetical protein JNK72_05890 [Myxococcales bacterium]|nr:hypothetical protein [Myxococcales bacterium]